MWNKKMKAGAKALVFKPSLPALPNLAAPGITHFSTSDAARAALCPTAGNREAAGVTRGRSYSSKPSSRLGLSLNLSLNLQKTQEASRVKSIIHKKLSMAKSAPSPAVSPLETDPSHLSSGDQATAPTSHQLPQSSDCCLDSPAAWPSSTRGFVSRVLILPTHSFHSSHP